MEKFFESRQQKFYKLAEAYQERYKNIAFLRISVFLVSIILAIYCLNRNEIIWALLILVAGFFAFGLVVNWHRRVKEMSTFNSIMSQINNDELKRVLMQIDDLDAGMEFMDESHPYVYDMDVFGKHSIYQLINRTATPFGREHLASELKKHFNANDIAKRQNSIKELSQKLEWRQSFQAHGDDARKVKAEEAFWLYEWLKLPSKFYQQKMWKPFIFLVWLCVAACLGLVVAGILSFYWIFLFTLISAFILLPKLKYIEDFASQIGKTNFLLQAYKKMLSDIEVVDFENEDLRVLKGGILSADFSASSAIGRLSKIISFIDNRANLFYIILNSFFMLDIYLIYKAESWKAKYGEHLESWLNVVAELESLSSFGGFSYSHPSFCFPEIVRESHSLVCRSIGHPLIKDNKRVTNDFSLSGSGAVALITGSNMAGKSTFLRTVGLNLILAQTGAPVCADEFKFSPCDVFSSMRTKDNLEESISTFYAELLRINRLISEINDGRPLFFLLDEILKGTNSHDRKIGARALIKQLNQSNTFGLVSSHDIELTELDEEIKQLKNYSFHSQIEENDIKFDYKLHHGPCKTFNAVALMKKMGISIP